MMRLFVAVLLVLASPLSLLGQEQQGQPMDEKPSAQRQTDQEEPRPLQLGLPIRIVEQPNQSEAEKRQEQEAAQREVEGLRIQQIMAESNERIVKLTIASTILTLLATAGLFVTLALQRRATKAAVDTLNVTQRIGEAETRAYIAAPEIKATADHEKGGIVIRPIFQNVGSTPAMVQEMAIIARFEPIGMKPVFDISNATTKKRHMLPNGAVIEGEATVIPWEGCISNWEGKGRIYVLMYLRYQDVFDRQQTFESVLDVRVPKLPDGVDEEGSVAIISYVTDDYELKK